MADNEDQPTRQRRAAFTKAAASIMEKSDDDSDDHSTTKRVELSSDDESRKSDRRSKKQKTTNGGSDEDSYSSTSSGDISDGSDKKKSSKKKSSSGSGKKKAAKKEPAKKKESKKKGKKPAAISEELITKIQNTSIKKLEKDGVPHVCILALKERKKLLKELGQDTLTPIQGTRDVFDKCVLHHPDMVWRTLKCRSLKAELPYLLAATDKSEKQMTEVLAKSKALSKKIKEFREEWKANSSGDSGDSLPVYAAKQLRLDPTPWMDAESFVPVDWEAVKKAQGKPELNDMFQDEYNVKKPIEEKESGHWSVETRLKIQRSAKDNYHGVGKSESSLSIHNGVQKEVCGNANTKLWDWCNGEIPDEHKDKGFECKFLQGDASQSGPWNGVWLKNMRGFALATNFNDLTRETKEGKQKTHTAEQSVKGYLHKCGWKEARCNELDYPAVKLDNPEREWFLFHKDFYPLGDGNEVVKNIDGCYYRKNEASK